MTTPSSDCPALYTGGQPNRLSFGEALVFLRRGNRLTRTGWNGAGMWVTLQNGYPDGIAINANTARATGIPEGTVQAFDPYLMMLTAAGRFVPWTATTGDLLAEDWEIVGAPVATGW